MYLRPEIPLYPRLMPPQAEAYLPSGPSGRGVTDCTDSRTDAINNMAEQFSGIGTAHDIGGCYRGIQ